jgi:hypothetical protein
MPLSLISFDGLLWLLLTLGPLILLQRSLHRAIQTIFLLISRRPEITVALFSLLFFPGVLLHEGSHFLMAKILGVPTGRVSFIPESIKGNRLRLGFVETASTDIIRDALIGTAPLITGGLFVAYAGIVHLNLLSVWDGFSISGMGTAMDALLSTLDVHDFWLWFYLIVTVSSTMFPSPSDRRAWLPVSLILALIIGLGLLFGAGPWMSDNLLPVLNNTLRGVAIVFAISAGVHLVVLIPTWLIGKILAGVLGVKVQRS